MMDAKFTREVKRMGREADVSLFITIIITFAVEYFGNNDCPVNLCL